MKTIDRIAKEIHSIFILKKWVWGITESSTTMYVAPTSKEIKDDILYKIKDMKDDSDGSSITSGRIKVTKDSGGYNISIDFDDHSIEELESEEE